MMPNMDPRALKKMMERMGIRSEEIDALRVTIETRDKNILIDNPQVTLINAQGSSSFQITGDISETEKSDSESLPEISEDDVKVVMEQSGTTDEEKARDALTKSKGNIAEAIMALKGE